MHHLLSLSGAVDNRIVVSSSVALIKDVKDGLIPCSKLLQGLLGTFQLREILGVAGINYYHYNIGIYRLVKG